LADNLRYTVETVMNLHLRTNKPMTTVEVLALFRMMAQSSLHIVQHIQMQILKLLQSVKVYYVCFWIVQF